MYILSSTDNAYLPHFCGLLHSAWIFNPTLKYGLIDTGITEANLTLLKEYAARNKIDLTVFPAAEKIRDALPAYKKRSAFGRVLIPEFLPDHDRAIYLDADMTVNGDLSPLLSVDLEGKFVAACLDTIEQTVINEMRFQQLDYAGGYFNTGMMVMDLTKWRKDHIAEKVIEFANENPDRLPYMDQSATNVILLGQAKIIPLQWNFFNLDEVDRIDVSDVRIIHHTNPERPWKSALNPFADLYRFHRNKTPWPLKRLRLKPREIFHKQKRLWGAAAGINKYEKKADIYRIYHDCKTKIAEPAMTKALAAISNGR